jgi:PAS domain S-box-containing protein
MRGFMRSPIWKRSETWGLGLAILTLIVMTVSTLQGWTALLAARDELFRTQQIDIAAAEVLQTVLDAETGERGFLLTGNEAYLEPYRRADALITLRLDTLTRLTRKSPEQQARVKRLDQLADAKMAELGRAIEARRTGGLPAALELVNTGEGRRTMDAIRATIVEIERSQDQMQAKLREEVLYYRARVPIHIGAGSGLLFLLLSAAFIAIRREANAREDALTRAEQSRHDAETSRDLLALTLRSIGDAVIVADTTGRITMLNSIAADLTGWSEGAVGRPVQEVFRIVNEYTHKPVEDPIEKIRRSGKAAGLTNHSLLVRADGREVPIDHSGAPILGPNRELAGFVLVFRDITERKQHEQALLVSEQRFRTMANAAPALLWLAAPDGTMSFFNRQWLDFTGRQEESQIGFGWMSDLHPDDLAQVRSAYTNGIRSKEAFQLQMRLRRSDGAWRTMLCSAAPYTGAGSQHGGFVGACFDISDLEAVQRSLEVSERRFRTLVAGTTALVWQTDAAGNFNAPIPQWEEFTGQKWPAYGDRGALDAIHPDDRDRTAASWEEAVRTGQPFHAEFRLWNAASRSWRDVISRGIPLKDRDGTIIEWIGTITDYTERRALEEKLRQAAKAESLGILAGGIAHDFNNLLVGILGNASLLEASLANETHREIAREVMRAAERAAGLTRQMLAYSGHGRFVVEEVNLAREIAAMEPRLREMVPAHIQLKLELGEEIPPVQIDRTQFEQLLMSLTANAGEAIDTDSGVVTIAIQTEKLTGEEGGFVFDDRLEPGTYAVLEVRDTGHGMDPATQSKIFDPFFTTKFTGRGLGLAAVSGIVRGHEGGIRIESRVGEGSIFRIYLPCAKPGATKSSTENRGTATALPDARPVVLVVDDEGVVRNFAASALQRAGYRALLAEGGARAVELFRADPNGIAAVLLDLTMPAMNGQQTLAALRAIRPDVKIIATSGYSQADALPRFSGKVEGFIQKPYTARALAATLRVLL